MKKALIAVLFMLTLLCTSCGKKEAPPPYPVQAETQRVIVYAPDSEKEYAQAITEMLSRLHTEATRNLGIEYDEQVKIIMYSSFDEAKDRLGDITLNEFMDPPKINGIIHTLTAQGWIDAEYYSSINSYFISEKYLHSMMESINEDMPLYLKAAVPAYFAEASIRRERVQQAIHDSALPTIAEFEKIDSLEDDNLIYGYILVDYITAEYGYDKLSEFIQKPNVKKVFGKSEDEFYSDWVEFSKNAYAKEFENEKETEHFRFRYDNIDENVIPEMSQILENNFDRITATLGVTITEKVTAEVYPDFDTFGRATLDSKLDGNHLGQAFGNNTFGIVSPNDISPTFTRDAMLRGAVHEFVHIALNHVSNNIPAYLHEGTAAYLAQQNMDFGMVELYIPRLIKSSSFPTIDELKQLTASVEAYIIGYVLIEYIDSEYGSAKLVELLKNPDYEVVFEKTEEEFHAEWVSWLTSKYCK